MASIEIHAGDWGPCKHAALHWGTFVFPTPKNWRGEPVPLADVVEVEIVTQENVKKMAGAIGWGVAGSLVLGPVGLLAGVLAGGRKQNVTFLARFKDGRSIMATADSKTFIKIQSAAFDAKRLGKVPPPGPPVIDHAPVAETVVSPVLGGDVPVPLPDDRPAAAPIAHTPTSFHVAAPHVQTGGPVFGKR